MDIRYFEHVYTRHSRAWQAGYAGAGDARGFNGVTITEELMLLGGFMMEVILVMLVLSQVLKYKINQWENMTMGVIVIAMIVMNNPSPYLDEISFMSAEIIALVAIIGIAWRWEVETSELRKKS